MGQFRKQLEAARTLADGDEMESIRLGGSTVGLLLVKMNREHYALSWAHFANAKYFPTAPGDEGTADDRIEMEFSSLVVTLYGRNLGKLMDSISEHRISYVPESAERYLMTDHVRNLERPIVTRIDVEKRR